MSGKKFVEIERVGYLEVFLIPLVCILIAWLIFINSVNGFGEAILIGFMVGIAFTHILLGFMFDLFSRTERLEVK